MTTLCNGIEVERAKLEALVHEADMQSPLVLEQSQKLDKLLSVYMDAANRPAAAPCNGEGRQ